MTMCGSFHIPALLRTPHPHPGESLNGYLLRVSEENRFESITWLLHRIDASPRIATSRIDLKALSALVRVDRESLRRMTYWPLPGRLRNYASFHGKEIKNFHIQMDPARVCPDCLRAAPFARDIWDIRLSAACADHGTLLLDRCPACSAGIAWTRRSVCRCGQCGYDFRQAAARPANRMAVFTVKAILRALGVAFEEGAGQEPLPAFLDDVPAGQLLDFIKFLGAYGLEPLGGLSRVRLPRRNPDQLHLLLTAAGEALHDWPNGFYKLLDQVRDAGADQRERSGLSGLYGDFYIALLRRFSEGPFAAVGEAFPVYINQGNGDAFATRRGFRFDLSRPRDFMTRPEVAEFLEISGDTVDVLCAEGEIVGNTLPLGPDRTRGIYDRQSVEAYRDRRLYVISSHAASRRLGLSPVCYRHLVDAGVLEASRRATYRARKAYEIDERRIDALLVSLDEACAEAVADPSLSYHSAVSRLGCVGLTGADLLKACLAGAIRIAGGTRDDVGLHRYRFSESDVDGLIRERAATLPPREKLAPCAAAVGIEPRYLMRLLQSGIVRAEGGPDGRPRVPAREVAKLRTRYVSAREIASRTGKSQTVILNQFCGAGYAPLLGRSAGTANALLDRQATTKVFGEFWRTT
ncbi:TniQ family protein [Ferrovibrio sp.]|uniref:TniQ family protein n=1 Tax=Ferrovibrio sp. TaxID=1917215 RepID=UPI00311FFD08